MDARGWFLAFHLIGLFIYVGGLLNLSRLLGYHVKEGPEVRARLSWMEKRMYFFVTLPGLLIAVLFGVFLLFGVGQEQTRDAFGQPISHALTYMRPKFEVADGEFVRSGWYVTFHAKFTLLFVLLALDAFLGYNIVKLGKGGEPPKAVRFKILHGMIALVLMLMVILMAAKPLGKDGIIGGGDSGQSAESEAAQES